MNDNIDGSKDSKTANDKGVGSQAVCYTKKHVLVEGTLEIERIKFYPPISCKHNCDMGLKSWLNFWSKEGSGNQAYFETIIEKLHGKKIKLTVEWV